MKHVIVSIHTHLKKNTRSFLFCCVLLLSFFSLKAQTIISGKILEKKSRKPISSVNITLNRLRTESISGFAISDVAGRYDITVKSDADSLTLHVRSLGYASQVVHILNKSQIVNFELEEGSFELKEIKVTPQPIRRYGDTLSYAVSAFKDKNDRVIADIIKKLPGVEIEPNGRILYQGEPINKYYIEGLDLLEGRYKLANDNLNAESVATIEIIENHQPVKMLDSLVFSDKAALNIKLKKNISTTGQASIGAGFYPLLWDVNLTPMLFTKNTQLLASYQTNNTGKNTVNQLSKLTPGIYKDGLSGFENKQDWLAIQQLGGPPFKSTRWLDNNSHIGSINLLRKSGNQTEIRLNSDYSNDIQTQEGYTRTLFYTSREDSIKLTEDKYNRLYFNNLKTDLTVQKNTKTKYLSNSLKVKAYWDQQIGNLESNNGEVIQQLKNPFYSISNTYKNMIKAGKSIITLNSSLGFGKSPQQLQVFPGSFTDLINAGIPYKRILQKVTHTNTFMNNSVQWIKGIKRFSFEKQLGFTIEKQKLESNLSTESGTIKDSFANHLNWLNQKYYTTIQSRYRKNDLNISLTTPVNLYIFNISDKILNKKESLGKITFEPRLSLNYKINSLLTVFYSTGKENGFGDINQLYYGYILNNYRNIKRSDAPLLQFTNYSMAGGTSYRNPLNATFGGGSVSLNKRKNNLLFINSIEKNGGLEQNAIKEDNFNHSYVFEGRIGKFFRSVKTTVTLSARLSRQKGIQMINDKRSSIVLKNFSTGLMLSSSPSSWLGVDYTYKPSGFRNIIDSQSRQLVIQQNHELKLNLNPKSNMYLGIAGELYSNNLYQRSNIFTDLILRKTISKKKIDLEVNWNNIFNATNLHSVSSGSFSYVETLYQLRPTQVLIKTRFSF